MDEEIDLNELRSYLEGQADLGGYDLVLDEPWALQKPSKLPHSAPAPVRAMPTIAPQPGADQGPALVMSSQPVPSRASSQPAASFAQSVSTPAFGGVMPAPRPVKKTVSAFESADSLNAFYEIIAKESVYAGAQSIARYEGPEHPQLLLLFDAPRADIPLGQFLASPTGEMLVRLFASLHVEQSNIGVAFFYKSTMSRNLPPLLETALRKMLAKELSFIAPQTMVTFGEPLFHQIFGKGKNFNDCAGSDMDFNGVKTTSLVDAFAMAGDKQLKWVTWKVHIPRGTYFKA